MTEVIDRQDGNRRLIIDLGKCDQCSSCALSCSLNGSPEFGQEQGRLRGGLQQSRARLAPTGGLLQGAMMGLREKVTFGLLCRRCKMASCVLACPFDAIERLEDGVIKRHNLRCVSCKSCAHACPFGTIYSDMLTFYDMPYESYCASCLRQIDGEPACVASCGQGALEYRVIDPAEADVHVLDEYVAARVRKWSRHDAGLEAGNGIAAEMASEAEQGSAGEAQP